MGTKKTPGKFDCYANALDDEPMFVLLARDPQGVETVRYWAANYKATKEQISENKRLTVEQYAKYSEALECAEAMTKWRSYGANIRSVESQKRDRNTKAA